MSYTINLKAKKAHSVKSPIIPVLLMLPRFPSEVLQHLENLCHWDCLMAPLLPEKRKATSDLKSHCVSPNPSSKYLPTFNKTNIQNYLTHAWKHQAVNLRLRICLWIGVSVLPHGHSVVAHRQAHKEGALQPAWCSGRKQSNSWVWCGDTSTTNEFL